MLPLLPLLPLLLPLLPLLSLLKARSDARAAQEQLAARSSTAEATSKLSATALLLSRAAGRASIDREKQRLANMSGSDDKRLQSLREDLERVEA